MADIELIIKIDKEQYEFIKQRMTIDKLKDHHLLLYDICDHIKNGIILPNGHGKIVDISKIDDDRIDSNNPVISLMISGECIEEVPLNYLNSLSIIIEAESEE